jgi:acyl-CoA reductase-like NAD-dependent aldehyde dehydrogenase
MATAPKILPGKLFINGEWREASDGERRDVINPATGTVVSSIAWATAADVDAAVAAARAAFDKGDWSKLSGRERSRILMRVSQIMRERSDELAYAESVDVGKPITLANVVDVNTAIDQYEYVASLAQHLDGATRETPLPAFAYTRREPHGVVGAITPFNFPLILASSKIAPALAAGNTVVHKPASDTPLSALIMADIFTAAGVPAGVVNVVTGSGAALGDQIVSHPDVLPAPHLTPVTADLGGNAANIVFADADVEKAIGAVISAFVFNTGQFCMGGPRLLVERPLYETVLGILGQAVPGVPLGDPLKPETVIGPLSSKVQFDKVSGIVEAAIARGAKVVAGGKPIDLNGGYFFEATVLADLPNDDTAVAEEIFGPVLTVQPFDTEEEAIQMANSTPYGLAAGLQTTNIARAHRVAAALEAGIVWVNSWALLDPAIPFGGVKASGWGREYGPESLEAYTRTKSVVISTEG